MDKIAEYTHESTRIWASRLSQSHTLSCSSDDAQCRDFAIVQQGIDGHQILTIARFTIFADYSDYSTVAGAKLGLKGEMFLVRGYSYYLTTTHFCWIANVALTAPSSPRPHASPSRLDDNEGLTVLQAHVNAIGYVEQHITCKTFTKNQNIHNSYNEDDGEDKRQVRARLFPLQASFEMSWLALADRYMYEHDEQYLRLRRSVVELGLGCATWNDTVLIHHTRVLYKAQCSVAVGGCQTSPSYPYRRLGALHTIHYRTELNNTNVTVSFMGANTMTRLAALLSTEDATRIAIVQLFILTLAASVSFVRSTVVVASPTYIMRRAYNTFISKPYDLIISSVVDVIAGAAVGVLALCVRCAVISFEMKKLLDDNSARVVFSEILGCSVSFLHFIMRNVFLKTDFVKHVPLTQLGGSMTALDASCAILVSFSETPLYATRETFSSVGRMLSSLLILVSGLQTLMFGQTACVLTAISVSLCNTGCWSRGGAGWFVVTLWVAWFLWVLQTLSVSVTLSCTFVVPLVYNITRTSIGSIRVSAACVLCGILCISLPSMNRMTLQMARFARVHDDDDDDDDTEEEQHDD